MAETIGSLRVNLSANSAQFTEAFEKAQKAVEKASKQMTRRMKRLGRDMQSVGKQMSLKVTAPLLAIGAASAKLAIDFESSFAGVRKTVNATEAEFTKLAKGFRNLSKEIPININEINRIGEAAGQLGIKTKNILNFTKVMADLGVTTNLSSDQAATALARLANITGLSQDNFDRLGSTIVALGNNLATTESEVVEMGLRLAAAGSQIGLTEAQILGMAGALSSLGIEAQAGGTAFSKVMISMASAVDNGGKKLEQFAETAGLTVDQFKQQFKEDAAGAIDAFIQGLGNAESQGKTTLQILKEMGIEEVRLRDALLRAAGAGDLLARSTKLATTAWEENTALTKEAQERYKTLQSKITLLWNRLKDIGITIGNALTPAMQGMIDILNDKVFPAVEKATKAFGKLSPKMQTTILAVAGIAAAIGPLLIGLGLMLPALAAVGTALAGVTAAGGLITSSLAGIALGVITVVDHWWFIKDETERAWNAISDFFEKTTEDIKNFFVNMLKPITEVFDKIENKAQAAAKKIRGFFGFGDAKGNPFGLSDEQVRKNNANAKKVAAGYKPIVEQIEKAAKSQKKLTEDVREFRERVDFKPKVYKQMVKDAADLKELNEGILKAFGGLEDALEAAGAPANALKEQIEKTDAAAQDLNNTFVQTQGTVSDVVTAAEDLQDELSGVVIEGVLGDGEVIGQDFGHELAEGMLNEMRNTLAGSLAAIFKGEIDSIMGLFRNLGNSLVNIVSQGISGNIFAGLTGSTSPGQLFGGAGGGGGGGSIFGSLFSGLGSFGSGFSTNPFGLGGIFGGGSAPLGGVGPPTGGLAGNLGFNVGQFALLGAPLIGAALGGLFDGASGAISGGIAGLGVLGGTLLGGPIGGALGGLIGNIIGDLVAGLFGGGKKDFKINLQGIIDNVLTGQGIGRDGDIGPGDFSLTSTRAEKLKEPFLQVFRNALTAIKGTLQGFGDAAVAELLSTDIEINLGGRFKSGDKAKKNLEAGITGGFIRPLFEQIEGSFVTALSSEGISAQAAGKFVDAFHEQLDGIFEATKDWDSRTQRGELMSAALTQFLMDMTNIQTLLNPVTLDPFKEAITGLKDLTAELGIEAQNALPSLQEIQDGFRNLFEAGEFTSEVVGQFAALRRGIVELKFALSAAVSSTVGFIADLNASIVSLGGQGAGGGLSLDALRAGIDNLQELIGSGLLTPAQVEQALNQMKTLTDQLVGIQIAAQGEAQQALLDGQIGGLELQISHLTDIQRAEEDKFRTELEALNDALKVIEQFDRLSQKIGDDLRSLFTGSNSVLTPFEKLNFIQAEVVQAQRQLRNAGTAEERLAAADKLRGLSSQLIDLGSGAFGTGSAEFQSLFTAVASELQGLLALTEGEAAKADTLNSQIANVEQILESIPVSFEASISVLRERMASLQETTNQLTGQASAEALQFYEYIRDNAIGILTGQLESLGEVTSDMGLDINDFLMQIRDSGKNVESALASLAAIEQAGFEGLATVLRPLGVGPGNFPLPIIPAAHGFDGFVQRPTLFLAGENGIEGVKITPGGKAGGGGGPKEITFKFNHNFTGDLSGAQLRSFAREEMRVVEDWMRHGPGREIIREIVD